MKTLLYGFIIPFGLSLSAQAEIALKGDFRFRTENIKEEQVSPLSESDRTRQRMRLRLTATGKVNETTEAIAKISTGSTTPTDNTTNNQDLTDYYGKKSVVLDQAYFNWKAADTVTIMGGKTPIPFTLVGQNDLIFDTDLSPEGLSLKYLQPLENGVELFVNTSATWLNERFSASGATDNTDVGLVGAQIGANYKAESWNAALVVGSFNFSNIKGSTALAAKGNSLAAGAYTHDYKLTTIGLELGTKVSDMPLTAYVDNVTNSDGGDYKTAGIVGLKLGKLKDKASWAVSVDTREVEKDSTVGVLSESDVSGGGTDMRGTRVAAAYQVADNANITLTYMTGKRAISSTVFSPNYNRAWFDFNFQF